jgi:hypothetical protein
MQICTPRFALALLVGCAHATPVGPAPISAEDAPKLQAALVGNCTVTETQKEGGEKKHAEGLMFSFADNGQASYDAMGVIARYTYKLDGRNVLMDGPFKALRVDEFDGPTMKWFVYDLSEYYYCTRMH